MMADNQNHQLNSDQIRDLLSAYLDNEVTAEERTQVEAALAESGELRQALETLRRTIALVAALPAVSAPRPFTLTEADVSAVRPTRAISWGLPRWATGVIGLAAALLCVLIAGSFFSNLQYGEPAAEIANAPAPDTAVEAPPATEAPEAAAPLESTAREQLTQEAAVEAVEEAAPPSTATEETMAAAAEAPAAADQAAPAQESMALESQATTETYKVAPAEQPAADESSAAGAAPAASEPTQEMAQAQAESAEEAEVESMAAESAVSPTEPTVPEQSDLQTNPVTAASTLAPEPVEIQQSEPTVIPSPQPSATPVALLTLPVPETSSPGTPAPAANESSTPAWGLTFILVVVGLLALLGGIMWWRVNRGQNQEPE